MSKSRSRKKPWLISILLMMVLLAVGIWWGVPWGLHAITVAQLESLTGQTVTVEDVSLNYWDRKLTWTGLALQERESEDTPVTIDQLEVWFKLWPLWNQRLVLPQVVITHPVVRVVREGDGTLNVSRFRQKQPASTEPSEFVTVVQDFQLHEGTVVYQDLALPSHPQARLDDISLQVADFSTKGPDPIPVSLSSNLAEDGHVTAKGQMTLSPFSLDSEWDIQTVHLSPYRDFISGVPPLAGVVNSSFTLNIPPEGFSQVRVAGNLELSEIKMGDEPRPFLTSQRLAVSDVSYAGPRELSVADILIQSPALEILRDESGTLPLMAMFQKRGPDEQAAGQATPAENTAGEGEATPSRDGEDHAALQPRIAAIQLREGRIQFIDRTVQPEYRKEFHQVTVSLKDLTGQSGENGRVEVSGSTPEGESIELKGDIRVFGGDFYLDMDGEIQKFSIASFNPYSEQMLGWGTQSGELSTDIHVHIEEQKLKSESKIGISDLRVRRAGENDVVNRTLGMPLGLVVDLIKNIKGEIKLKIDVDGPLNKPEFSIKDAIWKSIRNAVVNIVTAPLRLIGNLVKRGSKIQKIEIDPVLFQAGTTVMSEGMEKRISDLQQFLKTTPHIRLTLSPVVSALDRRMLRIMSVTSRIVAIEAEQSLPKGVEGAQSLYRQTFPDRTPPDQEVAILEELVAHEPDPAGPAAVLAGERAKAVQARLTASAGVKAERLLVEELQESSEEDEGGRVEFGITR